MRMGTQQQQCHSVSCSQCQHLQPAINITTVNSGPLIGWLNFHTFICTGNIVMCWEPDSRQRIPVFKNFTSVQLHKLIRVCTIYLIDSQNSGRLYRLKGKKR